MNSSFRPIVISLLALARVATAAENSGEKKPSDTGAGPESIVVLEKFVAGDKGYDPKGIMPDKPMDSAFGFARMATETPRAITYLSGEMMDQFGVANIADLTRVAPSTYTSFTFGIQGGLDVRGSAADTYFRGMRRIENRASFPTMIGAADEIEIVRGPPSPIYGNTKIGGFMNYYPKTAKASSGRYFENVRGRTTMTVGSHNKYLGTFELGGPAALLGRAGGFYLYGQREDSSSYYHNETHRALTRQTIFQGTYSVDLTKTIRAEAGGMTQDYRGVGIAGWNRVTQDLIDHGTYTTGLPLLNLDTDGSGAINLAEVRAAGGLSFTVPFDRLGNPPALGAQYALNPATMGTATLGTDQVLIEHHLKVRDQLAFFDVIADIDENHSFKSKFFMEHMKQTKFSVLSFSRLQESFGIENKFIYEQKNLRPFGAFQLNNIYSANLRYNKIDYAFGGNQQMTSRIDLTRPITGNLILGNSIRDPHGYPFDGRTKSGFHESGFGMLSELSREGLGRLTLGGRYDHIDATSESPAGLSSGAAAVSAQNTDTGISYSASLLVTAFHYFNPYVTLAEQNALVTGSAGEIALLTVRNGLYTGAKLKEVGVKSSQFGGKLFLAASVYEQFRTTFDSDAGAITATKGRGFETEMRFVPLKTLSISLSATWQKTVFNPLATRTISITPEIAGYAESAAYAGLIRSVLPATGDYAERAGYPERIIALSGTYNVTPQWAIGPSFVHQSRFSSGVMKAYTLPAANVFNLALMYQAKRWNLRVSVYNATEARYFRANGPDASSGGNFVIPELPRTAEVKIDYKF